MTLQISSTYYDEIAFRESGGKSKPLDSLLRYNTVNSYNYIGKYQMGTAALIEAGFYQGPVYKTNQIYDNSKWSPLAISMGINSVADFLNNPAAQELAIQNYTNSQWNQIVNLGLDRYVGTVVNGTQITTEGLLAGAHLKGVGSLQKFLVKQA